MRKNDLSFGVLPEDRTGSHIELLWCRESPVHMAKRRRKKTKKNAPTPKFGDWRILATMTLAEAVPAAYPGGPSHEAGTILQVSASMKDSKGNEFGFPAPSTVALSMNVAIRAARKAMRLQKTLKYKTVVSPDGPLQFIEATSETSFFDYLESCMTSVVFSYQALETFCNYYIAAKITNTYEIERRGEWIALEMEDLSRSASTEQKLSEILPDILNATSPKGTAVWEAFKELKKARDSTVHLKTTDVHYGGQETDTGVSPLFSTFLRTDAIVFPRTVLRVIEHFGPPPEGTQWIGHVKEMV